jgi:hypothetical protein
MRKPPLIPIKIRRQAAELIAQGCRISAKQALLEAGADAAAVDVYLAKITKDLEKSLGRPCLSAVERTFAGGTKIFGHEIREPQLLTFTPAMATEILERHAPGLQKRMDRRVERMLLDMQTGHWKAPGTLSFDPDGRLLNGQHMLAAVAASGMSQDFIVIILAFPRSEAAA